MALVAARSQRWPVLWSARNLARPALASEAAEPKVAPAAPPRGPAWGSVALSDRLVVSLTAQAAGVSRRTASPAVSGAATNFRPRRTAATAPRPATVRAASETTVGRVQPKKGPAPWLSFTASPAETTTPPPA